jgi:glucokinase
VYLLFDIGGTKLRIALAPDLASFGEPRVLPTPASFPDALAVMREFVGNNKIESIAGGIAGTWDEGRTKLLASPHLAAWVGVPITEELARVFNCPVYLENDAAIVGLGEALLLRQGSAGQEHSIIAYLTISTGVGGARLVDGKIDEHGVGFEPGQAILDYHHPEKHFEDYVSGTAVKLATGQEPKAITDPAFWVELSKIVAIGLHDLALEWTPDTIIIGGSMMGTPGLDLEVIKQEFALRWDAHTPLPTITRATLGDLGGLHGALAFLKQQQ